MGGERGKTPPAPPSVTPSLYCICIWLSSSPSSSFPASFLLLYRDGRHLPPPPPSPPLPPPLPLPLGDCQLVLLAGLGVAGERYSPGAACS